MSRLGAKTNEIASSGARNGEILLQLRLGPCIFHQWIGFVGKIYWFKPHRNNGKIDGFRLRFSRENQSMYLPSLKTGWWCSRLPYFWNGVKRPMHQSTILCRIVLFMWEDWWGLCNVHDFLRSILAFWEVDLHNVETEQEHVRGYMAALAFCQRERLVMTTFWAVLQIMRVHGFDCMSRCVDDMNMDSLFDRW